MTINSIIKILTSFTMTILLVSCSRTIVGLKKEKVIIQKTVFKIQIPKGNKTIIRYYGGHGIMFTITYADSSFIYYSDDWAVATPNQQYYTTIKFYPPLGGITSDSTISGQQSNGRYWKEIFYWNESNKSGYWTGYKNISANKVSLFDKAISTLKR